MLIGLEPHQVVDAFSGSPRYVPTDYFPEGVPERATPLKFSRSRADNRVIPTHQPSPGDLRSGTYSYGCRAVLFGRLNLGKLYRWDLR